MNKFQLIHSDNRDEIPSVLKENHLNITYKLEFQKDSITSFWNEVIYLQNPTVQRNESSFVASKDIYDLYNRFCNHNGYPKAGKDKFYKSFKKLTTNFGIEISNSHDTPARCYGIGLSFNWLEI